MVPPDQQQHGPAGEQGATLERQCEDRGERKEDLGSGERAETSLVWWKKVLMGKDKRNSTKTTNRILQSSALAGLYRPLCKNRAENMAVMLK